MTLYSEGGSASPRKSAQGTRKESDDSLARCDTPDSNASKSTVRSQSSHHRGPAPAQHHTISITGLPKYYLDDDSFMRDLDQYLFDGMKHRTEVVDSAVHVTFADGISRDGLAAKTEQLTELMKYIEGPMTHMSDGVRVDVLNDKDAYNDMYLKVATNLDITSVGKLEKCSLTIFFAQLCRCDDKHVDQDGHELMRMLDGMETQKAAGILRRVDSVTVQDMLEATKCITVKRWMTLRQKCEEREKGEERSLRQKVPESPRAEKCKL